eukprot:403618-Pyramimonas_sp.AAC.1
MASGPRETTVGVGNRGARSTHHPVISTAPPNEGALARKGERKRSKPATRGMGEQGKESSKVAPASFDAGVATDAADT